MPNRPTRWDSAAWAELLEQIAYYRAERPGLGRRFLRAVRSATQVVREFPGVGRPWDAPIQGGMVRGHRVKGFPYVVYYVVAEGQVVVLAVAHDRRHPKYWAGRTQRWLG